MCEEDKACFFALCQDPGLRFDLALYRENGKWKLLYYNRVILLGLLDEGFTVSGSWSSSVQALSCKGQAPGLRARGFMLIL